MTRLQSTSPRVENVERSWLHAARGGDVDQMKLLREQHPKWLDLDRKIDDTSEDANESDESRPSRTSDFCSWDGFHLSTIGASALHTALWHGDDKMVEYLLEEGQNPDTEDDTGMSAIMLAIMNHNLQATRCIFRDRVAIQRNLVTDEDDERTQRTVGRILLFLRFHADVNKRCHRGKTALHQTTTDETYEAARLLISNGADVDVQDEEGKTPLTHCMQSTSLLVADLLMQHGASVHVPDKDGTTPLQLAVRTGNINMLQIILNHHQCVVTDEGEDFAGFTVMTAVDEGAPPIVRFLLDEEYATVSHQNGLGETPMHRAILTQRVDVTELLCAYDDRARVLAFRTQSDESCLHYAARYSTPGELRRLLDFCHRGRIEEDSEGQFGYGDATTLLNVVNSAGSTALFLAATSKTDSLEDRDAKTRLMLDAGAKLLGNDPFINSSTGQTSIMVLSSEVQSCLSLWLSECAESRFDDVTKFCMKYLAIVYSLHHTQLQLNDEVIGVMLSSGQAVDTVSLLLLLPFDRRASLALLEHIGVFGRQQDHSLIRALYEELAAAWAGLVV